MGALRELFYHMDWISLMLFVMSAAACLICLTVHELSHGLAAWRLGDPTAKVNGRLTLNPIAHIDWIGLFLLLVAGVGWAKPVPVDMRNFRHPKRDMAITALAGPVSNFLLALIALGIGSLLLHFGPEGLVTAYALLFFCQLALVSVGLGLFNLIPVPPLDGSRLLSACLPDNAYRFVMRYERFLVVVVVLLAWSGALSGPLSAAVAGVMELLCRCTGFPFALVTYYFF